MPIYEYLCTRCNTIFQFLVRHPSESTLPVCPKCDKNDRMSMAGLDTEDPKAMAKAIRHMADEMGEDLGAEVNEALSRLEAGEDPEKIERDLEESGFDIGEGGSPSRAPGLYEA
jgi:putative FmdB family regulatory protein